MIDLNDFRLAPKSDLKCKSQLTSNVSQVTDAHTDLILRWVVHANIRLPSLLLDTDSIKT